MGKEFLEHKFNGVTYRVDLVPKFGSCDHPHEKTPAIDVNCGVPFGSSRDAKKGMITLIHECLHASNWKLSEEAVGQMSEDIGSLLWKLGFRRTMPRRRKK